MSQDPMADIYGRSPLLGLESFYQGGLASLGGGSADAFNREALTGAINSAIQQGLQGLPTAADAVAVYDKDYKNHVWEYVEELIKQ